MEYAWNDDAELLAGLIIAEHHPRLDGVKIAYLFKIKPETEKPKPPKPPRNGRKLTLAKTARVSPKWQALMEEGYEFVIEFDRALWLRLDLHQQRALVDHELCHAGVDAEGYYLRHHDLEEFRDIVARHGFWKDDIREFAEASLPLFEHVEKPSAKWNGGTIESDIPGRDLQADATFINERNRGKRKRAQA